MPTVVNVSEAKAHLSDLIARAQNGEDIVIAKAGRPIVRLSLIADRRPREGGFVAYDLPDSFFDALPDHELDAWEGGGRSDDPLR